MKGVGYRVVDWIWRLCNMALKEFSNYRGISLLLSGDGKIYAEILVDRVCKVT